jgi:hypothetical protein
MAFALRALRTASAARHGRLAHSAGRVLGARAYSVTQDPMTGELTTPLADIEVRAVRDAAGRARH